MNKKVLALVGVIALGVGGVSTVALQSHAQNISPQPATTSAVIATSPTQGNSVNDTDNIQNDKGGVEIPDAAVSQAPNQGATSAVKQADTQENAEGTATDVNEVEGSN